MEHIIVIIIASAIASITSAVVTRKCLISKTAGELYIDVSDPGSAPEVYAKISDPSQIERKHKFVYFRVEELHTHKEQRL